MRSQQPLGTKRDQIVDDLRQLIFSGEIRRGERLRQDALAERFQTSITPVREAFRILESDGLVISEPHRGVRVAAVDLARVETIYVLRRLAETYAMRRATVRVSALDMRTAEALVADMERAGSAHDSEQVRRLNRTFHFFSMTAAVCLDWPTTSPRCGPRFPGMCSWDRRSDSAHRGGAPGDRPCGPVG
ncbi:GntR family transcriptional regulator [Streptomyces malaysiensis subsp. malaysiensis]